ncbi:hypothetical protein [Neogemmobacter tilapiae]|nr:hypothetical protein [Gemmobacter tilapiae]
MKIVERNSERLVLTRGPSLPGLLFALVLAGGLLATSSNLPPESFPAIAAVALVTGGIMVLFAMSRALKLTMDRHTDEFRLRSWSMLGPRSLRMPLGGLAGATLHMMPGSGGSDMRPALMLKTPRGPKEHPLSSQKVSRAEADRLIETINGWLANG